MKLNNELLKLEEWKAVGYPKDHKLIMLSKVKIDTSHITHNDHTALKSDIQTNNLQATELIRDALLNKEFIDKDVLITKGDYGYRSYYRIDWIPYLSGWTLTLGEALMIKDWMVN